MTISWKHKILDTGIHRLTDVQAWVLATHLCIMQVSDIRKDISMDIQMDSWIRSLALKWINHVFFMIYCIQNKSLKLSLKRKKKVFVL